MIALFKSPYKKIFLLSLFIYLVTAFFSEGYHHPDEHFQILEFSNHMLGKSPSTDLPWEFQEKIRPALQPDIAYIIIKVLNFINIHNPFTWALILRFITALLSWFLVCKISLLLLKDFNSDKGKKIFLFLSFFLWFIPYLSVRFSSENYSAITFLGALYLIIRYGDGISNKKIFSFVIAGLLLGFSFYFRFLTGFAIMGLGFWLIQINKINWKNLMILIVSGMIAIAFCILLDSLFYGKFVLTPINYFFANIIENKAAGWGVYPWWYYFQLVFLQAIPPISIFLIVFFFVGVYKKPTNIFVWCLIPYLIAHFFIGHKEMRFMFPMIFGFIYITALGIDFFIMKNIKYKKLFRFLFILCVVINIPILLFKIITPAQEAIPYFKFLYNYSSGKKITLLCNEKNAYDLVGLNANFYKSPNVDCIVLNKDNELSNYLDKYKPISVFLLERNLSDDNKIKGYTSENIYCFFPKWLLHFNINNWESRSRIWNIKELKRIIL